MERDMIPVWEKAARTLEETASYMGVGVDTIRALAHAARHGMGDFPAFWVWNKIKVSHRDLTKAAAMVENAKQMSETRGRGRPRKRREAVA